MAFGRSAHGKTHRVFNEHAQYICLLPYIAAKHMFFRDMPALEQTRRRKVTTVELAAHFRVTPRSIKSWRDQGRIPYCRINARLIRYDLAEVEAALAKK